MALPAARVIAHEPLARARATARVVRRRLRQAGARLAMRLVVLLLAVAGFAGLLAMTFVLAETAITVHPAITTHVERPSGAFLTAAPIAPVHGALASLRASQGEVESAAIAP